MGGIALGVALLFLIDPCFDRSYRGGRADALVFLTAIAACWLLSCYPTGTTKVKKWSLFGAGLLTGILPWIWTTAVLLLPLILVELWRVVSPQAGKSLTKWGNVLLPLVAGMLITAIGLAVPVWNMIGCTTTSSMAIRSATTGRGASKRINRSLQLEMVSMRRRRARICAQ